MFYYYYFFLPIKLSKLKMTRRPLLSGAGSQRDDQESFVLLQPGPTLRAVRISAFTKSFLPRTARRKVRGTEVGTLPWQEADIKSLRYEISSATEQGDGQGDRDVFSSLTKG